MIRFFSHHLRLSLGHREMAFWIFALLLLATLLFFFPEHAFAQDTGRLEKELEKFARDAQNIFNLLIQVMQAIFWPVLLMIGGLLDNDLIFGGEMGEKLREIWVQIRNLVNVIFVLILIVIAIYNVLGLGEAGPFQGLQLKTALRKFVIALIVVNFSFLGAKVFLDFTNVLTTAVFALPVNLEQEFGKFSEEAEVVICQEGQPLQKAFCKGPDFNARAQAFFSKMERTNIGLIMAISFGKLAEQQITHRGIVSLLQLTFNIIFGIVLYVVYACAFIALFIVLLARVAVLWVMVALSPLFALRIVVPQLAQLGGEAGGDVVQKFVKHAIAPLIIGIFLSVGVIMIATLNRAKGVKDAYFSQFQLTEIDPNALFTGMDDLQQVLVAIVVAVVVWIGVFAAAKDTVASGVTESMRNFVSDIGKRVAKFPTLMPWIPVKEGATPVSLAGLAEDIRGKVREYEKTGREARLFEEKSEYDIIKKINRGEKEKMAQFIVDNPGILKHQPDLLVSELRRIGLDKAAKKLDEVKDKDISTRVQALYNHESELKDSLSRRRDPTNLTRAADEARPPRSELQLKKEYAVGAPRPSPLTPEEQKYLEKQAKLTSVLSDTTKTFEDFNAILDTGETSLNEVQFTQLRGLYQRLNLTPQTARLFVLFPKGQSFTLENAMDRLKALETLKSLASQDRGTPDSQSSMHLRDFPPEFIAQLVQDTKNQELKSFLQRQRFFPQEPLRS